MRSVILRILAVLFCLVIILSGCSAKDKAAYSDNSANINSNGEDNSSRESQNEAASSESGKNGNSSAVSSNASSNKPNSGNNSSEGNDSSGTSSDTFPDASVQGGIVVGTTSKGYEITEINGATYINGTLVVNKTYPLPKSYAPGLQALCRNAFNKMKAAAKKEGISIWVSSGYRSYNNQTALYTAYCERDGAEAADRYSARPGHSEHQSGFAIDVNSASTVAYETVYKHIGIWLQEHCHEFGFIIRYPEGKESITGYKHEPWHIRYVGSELAKILTEGNLTIEEYFGISSSYSTESDPDDGSSSEGGEDNSSSSEDQNGSSEIPSEPSAPPEDNEEDDSFENNSSDDNSSNDDSLEDGNETGSDT